VNQGLLEQAADFAPEEVFMLAASAILCVAGFRMFWKRISVSKLGCSRGHRLPLYCALLGGFAMLYHATGSWAAKEIRDNIAYRLLVMAMGGATLTISAMVISCLGISLRGDAFERRNFAAVLVWSGAIAGILLIYTGASVGEGPSFWENVFSTAIGIATWLALWLTLELAAGVSRSVAEERDTASGLRMAGFLAAEGLILGRALAGSWHSAAGTLADFARFGWLALALAALAIAMEFRLRPSPACPLPSWRTHGVPAAVLYVALAAAWVLRLGWWEGAPK
jgi:hypothetical protein